MIGQKSRRARSTFVVPYVVVGFALAACNSSRTKPPSREHRSTSEPDAAKDSDTPAPVANGAGWTRAEWLRAVDGFVASPDTMPRLHDTQSGPLFDALITTEAWLNHDWRIFESDGAAELMRFFPSSKQLTLTLMSLGAVDEIIALGLYNLDVYQALVQSGTGFISRLSEGDRTKNTREEGLDKVRLGAAIGVCGLLYLVSDASETYQAAAFDRLTKPASYSFHSRDGLQLILATLDERLLKTGPAALQKQYARIRSVVATEHGKRRESRSSTRVTYQGLGSPGLDGAKLETVVSTTGEFSVALGPGGLASRVEVRQADGSASVLHRIELQEGDTRFEAVCVDGQTEQTLAGQFMAMGLIAEESQHSGQWLASSTAGKSVRMRVLSIGGRGCVASVEGPTGQVPPARVESFLVSLRPAD